MNSNSFSAEFAAQTLAGLYPTGITIKQNEISVLASEFYLKLISGAKIDDWQRNKGLTNESIVVFTKYSLPKLWANKVSLKSHQADYLASLTKRIEIRLPLMFSLDPNIVEKSFHQAMNDSDNDKGFKLATARLAYLLGNKSALSYLAEFSRTMVSAEDENEAMINNALISLLNGKFDQVVYSLDNIYLDDYKLVGLIELIRGSVIHGEPITNLLKLSDFKTSITSIGKIGHRLELVSWALASSDIPIDSNPPSNDIHFI